MPQRMEHRGVDLNSKQIKTQFYGFNPARENLTPFRQFLQTWLAIIICRAMPKRGFKFDLQVRH